MTTVRVDGLDRLRTTLRRAGHDVSQFKEANRAAANVVAGAARPVAPKRTGRLAATVRTGATQKAGVVRAGRAKVPYAGPIHWGWPARGIEAQPFLSDTARRTEPEWGEVYDRHVDDILNSIRGI